MYLNLKIFLKKQEISLFTFPHFFTLKMYIYHIIFYIQVCICFSSLIFVVLCNKYKIKPIFSHFVHNFFTGIPLILRQFVCIITLYWKSAKGCFMFKLPNKRNTQHSVYGAQAHRREDASRNFHKIFRIAERQAKASYRQ